VLPSGVQLAVDVQNGDLAVRPLGQAVSQTAPDVQHTLNRKADDILAGFAKNDFMPMRAAISAHRRDHASDLENLFAVFVEGHGSLKSYRVMGTVSHGKGRAWTLVYLAFEHGSEVLRFSWKGDHLMTIQRGAYPTPSYQHVASARFESASGRGKITFNLRADGTVESMTVTGRQGAVTAYRLDDLTALR
jgi:hypothetical protein